MIPIEVQQLKKVDTVIFGHDKFAFEMVHFVKSAAEKEQNELSNTKNAAAHAHKKVSDLWESTFVRVSYLPSPSKYLCLLTRMR